MPSSSHTRFTSLLVAGLLSFSLLGAACSDDSGDDDATGTTATDQTETSDWCDEVRKGTNVLPAKALESLESQAEVAPEELRSDYEDVITLVEFARDNPADGPGLAQRTEAAGPALANIATAAQESCGITIDLGL